jgi:hypothetical protein
VGNVSVSSPSVFLVCAHTHALSSSFASNDLEYYSPSGSSFSRSGATQTPLTSPIPLLAAVTTIVDPDDETNGFVRFTLSNITQHDLYYQGAEISSMYQSFVASAAQILMIS